MGDGRSDRRGRAAELLAAWLLRLKGYRILERRLSTPCGEIDLIARRGGVLVFVEVKRRGETETALGALGERQRVRIVRAAELYLRARPQLAGLASRFDLVAIGARGWPIHLPDAWRP
jgi:putative endonuclease